MSEFVRAAEIASIPPNSGRTVHVRGREFALWHHDGQFFCLDDTCPHRGGPLGAGTIAEGRVYCPMHGWGFDVRDGTCVTRPDRPVKTYPTRLKDGFVEILL